MYHDSGDIVSIYKTTLKHICVLLELKLVRCEQIVCKTRNTLYPLPVPYSLELKIVDSDNCLDTTEEWICSKLIL